MTSKAVTKWQTERAAQLDLLEAAHARVGAGPGGRRLADGLNRALVLQLAAEFQGFARDLHDEAFRAVVAALAAGDPRRQDMLLLLFMKSRRLDHGNAGPSTLSQDFGVFGIGLWNELRQRYPARAQLWHDRLALLREARNGLAHADEQKVAKVAAAGWLPARRSARRWRDPLNGLTVVLDRTVGDHLDRHLSVRAW